MTIRLGSTRTVFLIGAWALKLPRFYSWRTFLNGLLANMQERQFSATKWEQLCPVLLADPLGLFVLMPRVDVLETIDDEALEQFRKAGIPSEAKPGNYGLYNGRIVAIDYGS